MQLVVPRLLSLEPVPPSPRTSHLEARAQNMGVPLIIFVALIDLPNMFGVRAGYDMTP